MPELSAEYVPRDSLRGLARQYWRYGQYRARTSRLHPDSMRRSHLLAPALAVSVVAAMAPGGPWRRVARRAVAVYAAAVGAVSARQARAVRPADAPALALVFVTMHLSWGFGFLVGSVRFGPPWRAVIRERSAVRLSQAFPILKRAEVSPDTGIWLGSVDLSARRSSSPWY